MLNNFLKINLPYGMLSNDKGEWMLFNREYKPIGTYSYEYVKYETKPIFVKYKSFSEKKILKVCCDPTIIRRDEKGKIRQFWLYDDCTNPVSNPTQRNINNYLKRLMILAKLTTVEPNRFV